MFRNLAGTSLAAFVIGAGALTAVSLGSTGRAEAFSARYETGYDTPAYGVPAYGVPGYGVPGYGWRPPPPAVHGYWGQRRWQRYNHEFGYRAPPPPRDRYGYGYGWR